MPTNAVFVCVYGKIVNFRDRQKQAVSAWVSSLEGSDRWKVSGLFTGKRQAADCEIVTSKFTGPLAARMSPKNVSRLFSSCDVPSN